MLEARLEAKGVAKRKLGLSKAQARLKHARAYHNHNHIKKLFKVGVSDRARPLASVPQARSLPRRPERLGSKATLPARSRRLLALAA